MEEDAGDLSFRLAPAEGADDLSAIRALFRAYADSLGIDLAYQGFEAELAALPGAYGPPSGALLLARDKAGVALGCVALRPIPPQGCCEMKRLYVAPQGRGLGLGRALAEAVIAEARRRGYARMRLDTLPHMAAARALYADLGFTPIPAYYETPIADTLFLECVL